MSQRISGPISKQRCQEFYWNILELTERAQLEQIAPYYLRELEQTLGMDIIPSVRFLQGSVQASAGHRRIYGIAWRIYAYNGQDQ
jgi:hypothetical protein